MKEIDWSTLGFHYTEPDYIVRAACHNGVWEEPYATKDKFLHLHVSATCLQYGQEAFEGLKAFRGVDGKIRIFRWRENAKRMARSAEGLYMTPVPEELFGKAIRLALEKNLDLLPPYGTGATLYFRPLLIGTTPRLGVGPGRDFEFIVIPSPIGPYYPGKFHCTTFIVNRHVDRAAPNGTGQFKVGGNYAASFRATEAAHALGYDCLFLDAKYHRYIDECSAANFIGVKGNEYLTPRFGEGERDESDAAAYPIGRVGTHERSRSLRYSLCHLADRPSARPGEEPDIYIRHRTRTRTDRTLSRTAGHPVRPSRRQTRMVHHH